MGKVLKCGDHSSNPQNPPRSQHRGASLSCTGELGTAGAGSSEFRETPRLTQGGDDGGRRNPTPGYITAIDGNVELSPLLWLPTTGVTVWLFSGVLGSGCGSHGDTLPTEFSPQLPGAYPVTQLHCTPLRDAVVGLCSALCTSENCLPHRGPERGLQGESGTRRWHLHLIFAGHPQSCRGKHGFASLGSVWWLRRNIRGIGQHWCCAQSSRAQHFRAD